MAVLHGIDVSYAQGKIDWAKLKGKIDFAIIRCGFGGDYTNQDDSQWLNNMKGCEANGIPYGVYLYSYATTVEKAKSEAKHALRLLKGKTLQMPVFYDLEEEAIRKLGNKKILEIAQTFCEEIEKAGYVYGTYCNTNWYTNYLTDKWYDTKAKWLAQYYKQVTYKGTYDIWQYSSTGRIEGIKGNVDMNYMYNDLRNKASKPEEKPVTETKKSNRELAEEVLQGKWGNGADRKKRLSAAGHNPEEVQKIVNELITERDKNKSVTHVVKKYETLTKIATKYKTTVAKIVSDNNIKNPNLIYEGQKLIIKK